MWIFQSSSWTEGSSEWIRGDVDVQIHATPKLTKEARNMWHRVRHWGERASNLAIADRIWMGI